MGWKRKLTTYAALAGLATGAMHGINRFIYFTATLDNLLSNPNGNYYEWRFGKLFYTKKGSGAPILLIHDLNTYSSGYEWSKVEAELSKKNTVYTIDLLGCGRSDKPNLTYTNFLFVEMINEFISNVIGEKTDVIATGDSSAIILMSALNDESTINRIVLCNASDLGYLSLISTKRTKFLKWLIYVPVVGTLLYNTLTTKKSVEQSFYEEYFYDINKITSKDIDAYYESAHLSNSRPKYLFASMKGRYTNANVIHCLKSINNSVFMLASDGTPNNLTIAEQYQKYMPAIEIVNMKDSKHLPQMENPTEFIDTIDILLNNEMEES
ncbi:MAG: alpha/beta fold hydrolase [Lachnospiraceae bacterium]|nr:alpha/beta fold hydrolase [Lachnospiraceae bacterium]